MRHWPDTRVAAIVFDAIVLLIAVAYVGAFRRKKRTVAASSGTENFGDIRTLRIYRFLPYKLQSVQHVYSDSESSSQIVVETWGICGTKSRKTHRSGPDGPSVRLEKSRRSPIGCLCSIVGAAGVGLLFGLWIHFVPCLWWTCDCTSSIGSFLVFLSSVLRSTTLTENVPYANAGGEHDGEGVRGAIWFISWTIVTIYCAISSLVENKFMIVLTSADSVAATRLEGFRSLSDAEAFVNALRSRSDKEETGIVVAVT